MIEVVEVLHYVARERCTAGQRLSVRLFVDSPIIAESIAPSSWMTVHIGEYYTVDFAVAAPEIE